MAPAIAPRGLRRSAPLNAARPDRDSERRAAHRRLPAGIRLRVFLRSLTLQASWNRKGMQSLGFLYALWPALFWLYPDRRARKEAARRHLVFFNSHPYLASAILGGTLQHEERIARGEEAPAEVVRFKEALMFPFAAVGDSFFWLSLRPFAGALAALSFPWTGAWAVLIFLCLYDLPHLAVRIGLFVQGYRLGDEVVERVARMGLPAIGAWLRRAVGLLGGVALVFAFRLLWVVLDSSRSIAGAAPSAWPWITALGAAVIAWVAAYLLLFKRGPVAAGYLAILLGVVLGIAWAEG